jgi:hypothetical protein
MPARQALYLLSNFTSPLEQFLVLTSTVIHGVCLYILSIFIISSSSDPSQKDSHTLGIRSVSSSQVLGSLLICCTLDIILQVLEISLGHPVAFLHLLLSRVAAAMSRSDPSFFLLLVLPPWFGGVTPQLHPDKGEGMVFETLLV